MMIFVFVILIIDYVGGYTREVDEDENNKETT